MIWKKVRRTNGRMVGNYTARAIVPPSTCGLCGSDEDLSYLLESIQLGLGMTCHQCFPMQYDRLLKPRDQFSSIGYATYGNLRRLKGPMLFNITPWDGH